MSSFIEISNKSSSSQKWGPTDKTVELPPLRTIIAEVDNLSIRRHYLGNPELLFIPNGVPGVTPLSSSVRQVFEINFSSELNSNIELKVWINGVLEAHIDKPAL